jgi:hypothetical protein
VHSLAVPRCLEHWLWPDASRCLAVTRCQQMPRARAVATCLGQRRALASVQRYQAMTFSLCLCVSLSEEALASVSPYQAVTFPFTPAQTKLLVEQYAADILRKVRAAKVALSLAPPPPVGPEETGILYAMQACILYKVCARSRPLRASALRAL